MKMFSATDSSGMISGSWWTMRMPASCASRAEAKATGRPSTAMLPWSGACSPSRMRISVDLPAPFSPTSAVTVAGRQVEAHALERLDDAEPLGDAGERDQAVTAAPPHLQPSFGLVGGEVRSGSRSGSPA